MAWVDEEAAIFAGIEAGTKRVVTKYISEINFIAPAHQGDIVEVGVALKKVGRTSLTLQVDVRILQTRQVIVRIDEIVFVALDEDGKPTRHALSK
jgi:acyl-CoA hydrolase